MPSNIELSQKVETLMVEASAVLVAAGASGLVAVPMLPAQYQVAATAFCALLTGVGTTMLGVWHKFVNTLNATVTAQTQGATP